jgi:hypothetical protein
VAWYPFNGNANDESGNGNNGIVNNAQLTVDRFNNPNAAYAFSTSNSYIQLPFTSLQQYTFSIWVYDTNTADTSNFITSTNFGGPTGANLIYHSIERGELNSAYSIPLTFPFGRGYGIAPLLGNSLLNWTHIAITYDGLTIKQFLNGALLASGSPGVAALGNNIGNILISGIQSSFNGKLDDFGFWNRALSPQEIASLYSAPPPCQNTSSTIAATITEGETYSFNGQNLSSAGSYLDTLQNASGCDSLVTLNLTVEPAVEPLNCEINSSANQLCLGESSFLTINPANSVETFNLESFLAINPELQLVTSIGQSNYFVLNTPLTWNDAKAYGDSKGLNLFVINNPSEESLVYNSLPFKGNDFISYWIGLYQDPNDIEFSEPAGGWKWVDGSPFNYQNWFPSEPNNNVCCPAEENCEIGRAHV